MCWESLSSDIKSSNYFFYVSGDVVFHVDQEILAFYCVLVPH